jgi:hypothetical protein
MLMRRVALVDRTGKVSFEQLAKVAAAMNLQVQRDVAPIWQIRAAVSAVPSVDALPVGVSPIFLVESLPPGQGGVHLTKHKQPYAMVEIGDGWTVAASHECLEMLVDPSGNHLYPSNAVAIVDGQLEDAPGKFQYLVEVCDPCEDEPYAYAIDDVTVSDFYTPDYFSPSVATPNPKGTNGSHGARGGTGTPGGGAGSGGVRYSFTGSITRPRQVLPNGYLSWHNPSTGTMQQVKNFGRLEIVDLGVPAGASLREFVDNKTRPTLAISRRSRTESPRLAATAQRAEKLSAESRHLARYFE